MDFKLVQELLKLQQKVKKVKKEMENLFIESEVGGLVIVFNGNMQCTKVYFEKSKEYFNYEDITDIIHINKQMDEKMQEIEKDYKHLLPNK